MQLVNKNVSYSADVLFNYNQFDSVTEIVQETNKQTNKQTTSFKNLKTCIIM